MLRWFRFSIRELLLLVIVVSVLMAWRGEHAKSSKLIAKHYQLQVAHQQLKWEHGGLQEALQRQEAEPIAVVAKQESEHYRRELRDRDRLFANILKALMYEGITLDLSSPGTIGVSINPELEQMRRDWPQMAGEKNLK